MELKTKTVTISDYEIISPTLAKVVVSYTGQLSKNEIKAAILEKFDNKVAPVENSFQKVTSHARGGSAVGFVKANREVRLATEKELRASYRVMSSNILMDATDRSLWEIKQGSSGKFLARHGNEDLSELVQATVERNANVPSIRHIAMAQAVKGELASFVSRTGEMDYGFVLQASAEKVKILSKTTGMPEVVKMEAVTNLSRVGIPKSFHQQMVKACISREDKDQAQEYWKKLYSYSPAYMDDLVQQVEDTTWL